MPDSENEAIKIMELALSLCWPELVLKVHIDLNEE